MHETVITSLLIDINNVSYQIAAGNTVVSKTAARW